LRLSRNISENFIEQIRRTTKFTCCAPCGAVAPRVLGPARQRSLRPAKRELGFAGLGQALRAHLVTQRGFTDRINDTCVTKRQVNSALSEIIAPWLSARIRARAV
jgi:hypothetical protein